MTDAAAALLDFTTWLSQRALAIVSQEGEHSAMFFLLTPGRPIEGELFGVEERPVGPASSRAMAEGVRRSGAYAVAFVSEAWRAPMDTVPPTEHVGDSVDAEDILVVAGTDRFGNQVVFETPLRRGPDGAVSIGATKRHLSDVQVGVFEGVRAVWGDT